MIIPERILTALLIFVFQLVAAYPTRDQKPRPPAEFDDILCVPLPDKGFDMLKWSLYSCCVA